MALILTPVEDIESFDSKPKIEADPEPNPNYNPWGEYQ
jgi:hypothetical protein